jgi:hypothetical protein
MVVIQRDRQEQDEITVEANGDGAHDPWKPILDELPATFELDNSPVRAGAPRLKPGVSDRVRATLKRLDQSGNLAGSLRALFRPQFL